MIIELEAPAIVAIWSSEVVVERVNVTGSCNEMSVMDMLSRRDRLTAAAFYVGHVFLAECLFDALQRRDNEQWNYLCTTTAGNETLFGVRADDSNLLDFGGIKR